MSIRLYFFLLLLLMAHDVRALDPSQPVESYIRTRLTNEDGLPANIVDDIVQSQDGFLWVSVNRTSLTRFDGRHFTAFDQPGNVLALALAPDGDLWVGTRDDLERISAASLNQFGRLPVISYHPGPGNSSRINCLHFSRSGVLWVGTEEGLYRFDEGKLTPIIPRVAIGRIEEASNGNLLLITSEGFMEWDGSRAVQEPELAAQLGVRADRIFHVLEDSRGVTWFCTEKGVARRINGSIEKLPSYGLGNGAYRAYEDPRGTVWIAKTEGLFRATATGLEVAAAGMNVRHIYADRDGNLWIGTNGDGLFRFKDRAVRMFTAADGLPNNVIMTVLASQDGGLWTGANCGGVSRFDGRRFQTYNEKDGLLNSCVWALAEDANHDLWIGTFGGGAFRFRGGSFTQYSKAQGFLSDRVTGIVPSRDGSLWFATRDGVTHMRGEQVRNYTEADGLSSNVAFKVYEDRAGDIWVGTPKGIDRMVGDRFVNFSSLPKTRVLPIGEDRSGVYLRVDDTDAGIFRVENDRPVYVSPNIEPTNMVETEQGEVWLNGTGIFRVPPGGLQRLYKQDEPVDYAAFGRADGLTPGEASVGQPNSALTRDGKLWIATPQGLAMLDLPRLPVTDRKPAIYMEEVTVGRTHQPPGHELVVPPGTHHVELHFDAIELSSPEKIRLQYRLDSVDSEWLDAGAPAHAIYTNIPSGTHALHLRACNRDGIWDRVGIVYKITQQPYFYETRLFLLAAVTAGLLLLGGLYRLRLHQATARINTRLEERHAERTRIARELHDTLLQSFHGLLLRFQAASNLLPTRPDEAKQRLDNAIDQAAQAITEGRDAVHELRSSAALTQDLAVAMSALAKELSAEQTGQDSPDSRVQVEGTPRNLDPILRDEVYRIAAEALRNAFRHAQARRIEAEIRYDERQLRVRVRDDGRGIDPKFLGGQVRAGHWGLNGMRERAEAVGGNLAVWSEVDSGTEVELTIPASIAYAKSGARRCSWLSGKLLGNREMKP